MIGSNSLRSRGGSKVRPLTCSYLKRADHSFIDGLDEAENVRLRAGRREFFGAGFELLKPAPNQACQHRIPSRAREPPVAALN
jgi:hypothetical protein